LQKKKKERETTIIVIDCNHYYCLHILFICVSMIKSRRMLWAGYVARMEEKINAYRVLVGKSEGKRQLGRPRRRWVDNIKMDLREMRWSCMDWIDLVQDGDQWRALVSTVMKLRVP
jgi:hypothetical protein